MFEADEDDPPHGLQLDRAVRASDALASATVAVTCELCRRAVDTEYYQINEKTVCPSCRRAVESAAETPRGAAPFASALALGILAAIAGAFIYYEVIAILDVEIGIVAILIGYIVGYAVRRGAGSRGGRRFQIMAIALTYASVSLAYAPLAFTQSAKTAHDGKAADALSDASTTSAQTTAPSRRTTGSLLLDILVLLGLIAAIPILSIVSSFPSGLISAFIIVIGMRQAWRMTAAPSFTIFGPYKVGAAGTASTAS